jgi:hypothetical protein
VVTTASLAQALPDLSGHELPGDDEYNVRLLLVGRSSAVHGKEKVYGSIL